MNKLNIPLLAVVGLLLAGLSAVSYADTKASKTPSRQDGGQADPAYAGCKPKRLTTNTEILISSNSGVLLGVYQSTGAVTAYVTFRDTEATNGSGAILLDKLQFAVAQSSYAEGRLPRLPFRYTTGLTAQINNVSAGEEATVCYLDDN